MNSWEKLFRATTDGKSTGAAALVSGGADFRAGTVSEGGEGHRTMVTVHEEARASLGVCDSDTGQQNR